MSICINNDLIWISIPRCASTSVEYALTNTSGLHINRHETFNSLDKKRKLHGMPSPHLHYKITDLYKYFGQLETICIKRDFLDRWLSSLEYFWVGIKKSSITPIIEWEDIDNNFIYEHFNTKFLNLILDSNNKHGKMVYEMFTNDSLIDDDVFYTDVCMFESQNVWKFNEKCTYEFDIKELNNFTNFISNRYNVDFKIPNINSTSKIKNKIIINNELRNWIWNVFESPFEKHTHLL